MGNAIWQRLTGNRKNNGQVALEIAFIFVCIVLFLVASAKLATWAIGRMVVRQEDYEATRKQAGTPRTLGMEVEENDTERYQKLKFFE